MTSKVWPAESERKAVFGKSRPFGYHIGMPNIMKKLKIL